MTDWCRCAPHSFPVFRFCLCRKPKSGAFCFAMMFGGNLRSALAAAGAGLVASWYLLWCGRHEVPGGFQKISTAALITLVCILLCNLLHTSASHAIIGTLMILTPGIAFTMGIRDFVQGYGMRCRIC